MEKLLKAKKRQFIIAMISLAAAVLATFGIIFFIWMLLYVPMGICIAITAHGFYGCPFYFLNNAKLKTCISMLGYIEENENAAISDISAEVGFSETKTFCRVFKSIMGVTPGQYRTSKIGEDT